MKIKDIREYRSFYKTTIMGAGDNKNEHFLGPKRFVGDRKEFGWFNIYHGDKPVKNFLQSFLEMAKDGQAVYEFLQNAVDENATHFTMAWGKDEIDGEDYLLVANNGNMFELESVRSILNVGSSTKAEKSDAIGQYGIGFKLAHRLVGRSNGLEELIDHNYGPILFSWQDNNLDAFLAHKEITLSPLNPLHKGEDKYYTENIDPWLFKILITCFPALPENKSSEEKILLLNETSTSNAFKSSEVEVMKRWVNKYKSTFVENNYKEGSLFFIKLGHGKKSQLNNKDLLKGVEFSLSVLNQITESGSGLNTIQLNQGTPVVKPDLQYHTITVKKDDPDYCYYLYDKKIEDLELSEKVKIDEGQDIVTVFGFNKYQDGTKIFSNVPNLYLYFPLSEEVHNWKYIIHSNAFDKNSPRTGLQDESSKELGKNGRIFSVILDRIEEQFRIWRSEKSDLFLDLYAAFLGSGKTDNSDRDWINALYTNPLNKLLLDFIPYQNNDSYDIKGSTSNVRILTTDIEIDLALVGLSDTHWFFYKDEYLVRNAKNKLNLKEFTVADILAVKDSYKVINEWIVEDSDKAKTVISEINRWLQSYDNKFDEVQKENFIKLTFLEFIDGKFYSLQGVYTLLDVDRLIIYGNLNEVRLSLIKMGIVVSKLDLDKYPNIEKQFLLGNDFQLKNKSLAIQILNNNIDYNKASTVPLTERLAVFKCLLDRISDSKITRGGEIKLFRNRIGEFTPLTGILSTSVEDPLFSSFKIYESDNSPLLQRYTCSDIKSIYDEIIYYHWPSILQKANDYDDKKTFLDKIQSYISDTDDKLLCEHNLILYKNNVYELSVEDILFFDVGLSKMSNDRFSELQLFLQDKFSMILPDQCQIDYLSSRPWCFESEILNIIDQSLTEVQMGILIEIDHNCKLNIFSDTWLNEEIDGTYTILELDYNERIFQIENPKLRDFIATYLPERIKLLPVSLLNYEIQNIEGVTQLIKLIAQLISESNDVNLYKSFIPLVSMLSIDDQKHFYNSIAFICLFWGEDFHLNTNQLNFISRLIKNDVPLEDISTKLVIEGFETNIRLANVTDVVDSINVKINDEISLKLSKAKILLEENKGQVNNLTTLLNSLIAEDLIPESKLRSLLKLDRKIDPKEIVDRFNIVLDNNDDHIANTDQLLFLASNYQNGSKSILDFLLYNNDESSSDLIGCHFLQSEEITDYISGEYILHERYMDLGLRLFTVDDTFLIKIVDEEAIEEGVVTLTRKITASTPLDGSMLVTDITCDNIMKLIQSIKGHSEVTEWKWDFDSIFKNLGLTPKEYSIQSSFDNEKLPYELERYSEDILKLIGVDFHLSSINLLYSYLSNGSSNSFNKEDLVDLPSKLLINVLKRLVLIEEQSFFILLTPRFDLIIELFSTLLTRGSLLSEIGCIPCHISREKVILRELTDTQYKLNTIDWSFLNKACSEPVVFTNLRIIPYQLSSLFPALGNRVLALEIYRIFLNEDSVELSDDRYLEWKEENDELSIFQINGRPTFELSYSNNNETFFTEQAVVGRFYLHDVDNYDYQLYYDNNIVTPSSILESDEIHEIEYALRAYLSVHKDQMADFAEYLLNKDESGITDQELANLLEFRKEKERKEERKKLVESLGSITKYSYRWFEDYIQTLINYDSSDRSQPEQTIKFDKITVYKVNGEVNKRYAHLKGPNRVISQRIQEFQDVKLLLKFKNGKSRDITLTSLSRQGQSLVVLYPQGFQDIISLFPDLIQAKLRFTPIIDLRERLFKAFKTELQEMDWINVEAILPGLKYIYGPPGTGKTYSLRKFLENEIASNPLSKTLMVGPTNKAADVLVKRLYEKANIVDVLRVSSVSDPELNELNDDIYKLELDNSDLLNNVIATTVHRLPYFGVDEIPLFALENHWDYLIIDEASMVSIEYIVFVILAVKKYSPNCEIIIAGDPKQIPPVVNVSDKELEQLEIEELNIYRMMNISEITTAEYNIREIDKIDVLKKQYRSIQPIGNLYSQYGYQGILSTDRLNDAGFNLPPKFSMLNAPITFIDVPLVRGENVIQIDKLNKSPFHLYSALLVVELLRDLGKSLKEELSVGIITPYKSQAMIVERLITSADLSDKLNVICDTVHGFQGDEKKLIIFMVTPNNYYYTGHEKALLSKQYIYNVAISRAEDKLWIIHPHKALKETSGNIHIDKLHKIEHFRARGIKYISSSQIEDLIFENDNYIRTNSYITSHDSVNVYGLVDMGYFIKIGNNAIDIQIQGGRSILENEL